MAVYPETSTPYTNPVTMDIEYKTLVSAFDNLGEEKRKQKWLYPKRSVTLKYQGLSKDEAEVLWEFYLSRKGRYNSFSWFESTGLGTTGSYRTYTSEYVATGDSTTLVFVLPAKGSSGSNTVYVNGLVASTSDYTMSYGGGGDGEDKITFLSSDSGGRSVLTSTERITYDFGGRLKIRCRFADDIFSFENFYDTIVNSGVKLQGLLNL